VGLTATFAASTAVFNATYRKQARVDAVLTNGADVTVTETPTRMSDRRSPDTLASVSGVRRVEHLQHRFAYVGSDLQDLFGVDPASVVKTAKLQNAYFAAGARARSCAGSRNSPMASS